MACTLINKVENAQQCDYDALLHCTVQTVTLADGSEMYWKRPKCYHANSSPVPSYDVSASSTTGSAPASAVDVGVTRCHSMPNLRQCDSKSQAGDGCGVESVESVRIDEWYLTTRTTSEWTAPELGTHVLCGKVHNHPTFGNGDSITTSRVEWIDMAHRQAKTSSRVYTLGSMQMTYRRFILGHSSGQLSRILTSSPVLNRPSRLNFDRDGVIHC